MCAKIANLDCCAVLLYLILLLTSFGTICQKNGNIWRKFKESWGIWRSPNITTYKLITPEAMTMRLAKRTLENPVLTLYEVEVERAHTKTCFCVY